MRKLGLSAFTGDHIIKGPIKKFLVGIENGTVRPGYAVLLVGEWSRLTRQVSSDALEFALFLMKRGIGIIDLQDRAYYTLDRYNKDVGLQVGLQIKISTAHQYSATLSHNTSHAWRIGRADAIADPKKKIKILGRLPGWIRKIRGTDDDFELIPERAALVRKIVLASETDTAEDITRALREAVEAGQEIPDWSYKGEWTLGHVQHIITNPAVFGILALYEHTRVPVRQKDGSLKYKKQSKLIKEVPGYYPAVIEDPDGVIRHRLEAARAARRRREYSVSGGENTRSEANLFRYISVSVECGSPLRYIPASTSLIPGKKHKPIIDGEGRSFVNAVEAARHHHIHRQSAWNWAAYGRHGWRFGEAQPRVQERHPYLCCAKYVDYKECVNGYWYRADIFEDQVFSLIERIAANISPRTGSQAVSNRISELNAKIEDANRRETNAARLLIQNPDNENYQTAANEVAAELKALRNQFAVEKANNPNLPPDFFEVLLATHRAKKEAAKEELPAINAQLGISLGTILEPVHLTANGIMRVLFKPSLGQDIEYEMVEPPHARPPGWFQRAAGNSRKQYGQPITQPSIDEREKVVSDCRAIFQETAVEHMTSKELTKRLIEREYRPWLVKGEWQLSVVLKPYGVVPSDTVLTKTKGKLAYLASQFREVQMNDTGKGG